MSHAPNSLYKRSSNTSEFFGHYHPYIPKEAKEYRHETDQVAETVMSGPMKTDERLLINHYVPIKVIVIILNSAVNCYVTIT